MTIQNTAANGGQILTDERIVEIAERVDSRVFHADWYREFARLIEADLRAILAAVPAREPVNMILHCPKCGLQHIDAPDERTTDWTNPPHKSHLCHGCGHIWRPADVPTNGVAVIATKGSADSPAAAPAPVSGMPDLARRLNEIDRHLAKCRFTERHEARQLVYSMLRDVCGSPSPQAPDTPVASSPISRSHAAEGQWTGDAPLPAALAPTDEPPLTWQEKLEHGSPETDPDREQAGELPPLPAYELVLIKQYMVGNYLSVYRGFQMRDYASVALAARQAPTVPKLDYDLLKLTLEQTQERLRQAEEAIAKRDATALRVAQCAGEFARDAARFATAIALEDNAETLYSVVMSHAPDTDAIRRAFDAATDQEKAQ